MISSGVEAPAVIPTVSDGLMSPCDRSPSSSLASLMRYVPAQRPEQTSISFFVLELCADPMTNITSARSEIEAASFCLFSVVIHIVSKTRFFSILFSTVAQILLNFSVEKVVCDTKTAESKGKSRLSSSSAEAITATLTSGYSSASPQIPITSGCPGVPQTMIFFPEEAASETILCIFVTKGHVQSVISQPLLFRIPICDGGTPCALIRTLDPSGTSSASSTIMNPSFFSLSITMLLWVSSPSITRLSDGVLDPAISKALATAFFTPKQKPASFALITGIRLPR